MMSSVNPHDVSETLVTVVVPVWNSGKYIPACLESLKNQKFRDFSIIIVDDGSTDGSVDLLRSQGLESLKIISLVENRGFAGAVNIGIRQAMSKYIALLNVDVIADHYWLYELVKILENTSSRVGALASKMVQMDTPEIIDDAGDILSWYGSAMKRGYGQPADKYQIQDEIGFVCAGAALYRKEFFRRVGEFDENFTSYLEDVDLSLRGLLQGYTYLYVPTATVRHLGHSAGIVGSRYAYLMTRNRLILLLKNLPVRLLLRHLHQILYGQVYFFLVYKKPLASIKGFCSFLLQLPTVLRNRSRILSNLEVEVSELEAKLSNDLGEPTLGEILKRKCLS